MFGGYFADANEPQIQRNRSSVSYEWNSFRFEFAAPLYEQQSNIEYSYYLKGYDNDWSDWNTKTEKEYSYLPAGNYRFELKARNNLGNESDIYSYSFVILPPGTKPGGHMEYIAACYYTAVTHYTAGKGKSFTISD